MSPGAPGSTRPAGIALPAAAPKAAGAAPSAEPPDPGSPEAPRAGGPTHPLRSCPGPCEHFPRGGSGADS